MRLGIKFKLNKLSVNIEYRRAIMSFIKKSFKTYNDDFYNQYYGKNIQKPFGFSVFLPVNKIDGNQIILNNNTITVYFSSYNQEFAVNMYNAFNKSRGKKFTMFDNEMKLISIFMQNEKRIVNDKIKIKFLSPLVVRESTENSDYYHSYNSKKFQEQFNIIVNEQLSNLEMVNEKISIKITPVRPKKTVVKHYNQFIESSIGSFILEGNPVVLDYLYKACVGSRRSSGFGLFEVIS